MSSPAIGASLSLRAHPAVLKQRTRNLTILTLAGLAATAAALSLALSVANPSVALALGASVGVVGVIALMVSQRYGVTLTLMTLYLGMIDGPIKLGTGSPAASGIRDVLIGAISLGALARLLARRERVRLPPLSGWVIAFVLLVLLEAFNPETKGISKVLAGFKQHLEWIPFFFFGFLVMRSKQRFRKLFLLLGVIALANGVVSTVQTRLTPQQVASWGPGYSERINGTDGVSGRAYRDSSGKVKVRPMALGSDMGFGGYVGVLALPGTLALLALGRMRRRSSFLAGGGTATILCVGALVGVATSLQRTAVLSAVVGLVAFLLLSLGVGRSVTRPLGAILVVLALAFGIGSALGATTEKGVFSRYASITPGNAVSTSYNYRIGDLSQIPEDIQHFPFGAGLAVAGAARSFGGVDTATINGRPRSAESQYNYITLELGGPGLLFWIALTLQILLLSLRIRRIEDAELRLSLAAIFAALFAFAVAGFAGPTMSSLPAGPFFWFALGIASYWLAGPLRPTEPATGDPLSTGVPAA